MNWLSTGRFATVFVWWTAGVAAFLISLWCVALIGYAPILLWVPAGAAASWLLIPVPLWLFEVARRPKKPSKKVHPPRRYRFSIAQIMIAVAAIAVVLAMVGPLSVVLKLLPREALWTAALLFGLPFLLFLAVYLKSIDANRQSDANFPEFEAGDEGNGSSPRIENAETRE